MRPLALPTRSPRLYWDANCFIALLNAEPTTDLDKLQAIQTIYEDMLLGQVTIVTSDIFKAEVFGGNNQSCNYIYNELLSCEHFEIIAAPSNLFEEVGKLKQHVKRITKEKQKVHTADAVHIVVAKLSEVDEMWTTEPKLVNKGALGLFGSLKVRFPHVAQPRLIF